MLAPKTIIGLLMACAVGMLIGAGATYVVTSNRGLHIQSFSADTSEVLIGEKVTFRWNITGATHVAFRFVHLPTYSDGDLWELVYNEGVAAGLPPSGEWSYTVAPDLPDVRFKFEIEGSDEAANKVATRSDEIIVKYRPCFDDTPDCATPPTTTKAIIQPFTSGGYMLWREDTQTIYVLTHDLSADGPHPVVGWQAYPDTWAEGDNFSLDGQPPNGLLQPIPHFIKIIAVNYGLQADLGWATAPETTFEATIQQTRTVCSMAVGCTPTLLVKLADGRVLNLSASDTALQQGHVWNISQ